MFGILVVHSVCALSRMELKACLTSVVTDDPIAMVQRLLSTMSPAEQLELLDSLRNQAAHIMRAGLREPQLPTLRRKPRRVRGFRVRLDLRYAKPPVWRRLILPGDLTLDQLHAVIQGAMGWSDYHLHRFRTGADHWAPHFITEFDLEEGDEGILEDDVRLDQLVADSGDSLWYEYDFGDGWDHVLKVEEVLPDPPAEVQLVTGRRACPPEDVGGIGGYAEVAEWVESRYDDALLPEQFENATHAHDWLPVDWHPAAFDRDLAADAIRRALDEADEDPDGPSPQSAQPS